MKKKLKVFMSAAIIAMIASTLDLLWYYLLDDISYNSRRSGTAIPDSYMFITQYFFHSR